MLPSNSPMREAVSFRFGLKCFLNKYRKGLDKGNNKSVVIPYMYFSRTISDNGVYVYDCCYESPNTVIYHLKKYDKNEHITLEMLRYKNY